MQQERLLRFQGPPVRRELFLQFRDPPASEETQERQELQVPHIQAQQELQDQLDSGETVSMEKRVKRARPAVQERSAPQDEMVELRTQERQGQQEQPPQSQVQPEPQGLHRA